MRISRRTISKGATVLPLAANSFGLTAASPARVPQDLQIHRRARTGSDRNRAGSGSQAKRPREGHAGRRSNQPSGRGRPRDVVLLDG